MSASAKIVTLVLCSREGSLLGALPAFSVETPWWQEVADVVARARELHDLDVTILRLIGAEKEARSGGFVTYLAEVDATPSTPLEAWPGDPLADHPLRQTYARPGGPQRDLEWAVETLSRPHGYRTGRADQDLEPVEYLADPD